jgi:hypothetical protein
MAYSLVADRGNKLKKHKQNPQNKNKTQTLKLRKNIGMVTTVGMEKMNKGQ